MADSNPIRSAWILLPPTLVLLLGLPLLGVALAGKPLAQYTEFPPLTRYVEHASFSWPVFLAMALGVAASILWVWRTLRIQRRGGHAAAFGSSNTPALHHSITPSAAFPLWGWIGVALGAAAWTLAWTRFPWVTALQRHTFTPLWLAYIIVVNAWTFRRTGRCLLTARPRALLALFPLSAGFWWFFEYLNRFSQNWYYTGVETFGRGEYALFATLSFATVLPAVMSTEELLATFAAWRRAPCGRLRAGSVQGTGALGTAATERRPPELMGATGGRIPLEGAAPSAPCEQMAQPTPAGDRGVPGREFGRPLAVLAAASLGLAGLGLWPDYLFPLLWLAPLAVVTSLQALSGRATVFAPLRAGDVSRLVRLALAALICGIFWEMWNYGSLAKWIYAVPFVSRFHVFEMPLLGYAGYLPFGLECAALADLVLGANAREEKP